MAWIVHLLQLLTISVGNFKLDISPQIVGGIDAEPYEFPYQVSLQDTTSSHFCGGVILNKKYVITAAHCVDNISGRTASSIIVMAGSIDLTHPNVTNLVEKIIVHEKYDHKTNGINDIALLKMAYEFNKTDTVDFASLPPRNFVLRSSTSAVVSGWGRFSLSPSGLNSDILQRVDIVIANQRSCAKKFMKLGYIIHDTQICAYNRRASKGSCHGDSGGPLTVKGMVVGLTSWSVICGHTHYPAIYTRISSYLDWIKANAV